MRLALLPQKVCYEKHAASLLSTFIDVYWIISYRTSAAADLQPQCGACQLDEAIGIYGAYRTETNINLQIEYQLFSLSLCICSYFRRTHT